ncbi:MAG: cobalamin-binding protein [Clostridiales bacterium]|nr:cobalamin-binding protein [Clostridiales bacterium]
MKEYFDTFSTLLDQENKQAAVEYIISLLEEGKIDVTDLYFQVLTPALNSMTCPFPDKSICIWKEHIKTAIVRTIVECCYPYVLKKRDSLSPENKGTAVILCPPEEYHDLGARMAADFFTICGYETIYIGSNTPFHDFYNAVDYIKPQVIGISVSNFYNLVVTKKIVADLKSKVGDEVLIVVGGNAFLEEGHNAELIGADACIQSFQDVMALPYKH